MTGVYHTILKCPELGPDIYLTEQVHDGVHAFALVSFVSTEAATAATAATSGLQGLERRRMNVRRALDSSDAGAFSRTWKVHQDKAFPAYERHMRHTLTQQEQPLSVGTQAYGCVSI